MRILYSIGIGIYAGGVRIAALFNNKAKLMAEGWKRTFDSLSEAHLADVRTSWFHASSLGEFEQARPVLEQFKRNHPEYKICVTFFSPSGYEVRKNYADADLVCYLPMDTRANAARLIRLMQPDVAFFVKYDFWFNILGQLARRGTPTYIFSAIFRPQQYFFKWYGSWFRKQLKRCYTHLFVQNEESLQLLQSNGITQCSIAGDTRFDRVHAITQEAKSFPVVEKFIDAHPGAKVIVAGSSWEPDEARLSQYLDSNASPILILAPHVISGSHLDAIENSLFATHSCVRYSQLANGQGDNAARILIIDNVGMLASLYRYAHAAYIGGGFGAGIHNILEAVTFGKPVVFGPRYRKFKEACDIIALGGGFAYDGDGSRLKAILDTLLGDESQYQAASQICTQYLSDNLGSTARILDIVSQQFAAR